jgi:hypothetical protein
MSKRQIGFSWCPPDKDSGCEHNGRFSFTQIQPFLSQLTAPKAYLLITLPRLNLDFSVLDDLGIEMEIMDSSGGGDHFASVSVSNAEVVTRIAVEHWDTDSLRPLLSDLPLNWLT